MRTPLHAGWRGEFFVADDSGHQRLHNVSELGLLPRHEPVLVGDPVRQETVLIWVVNDNHYSHRFHSSHPVVDAEGLKLLKVKVLTSL